MQHTGAVKDGSVARVQLVLAFVATYVFWGASFLAVRFAVQDIPPLFAGLPRHLRHGARIRRLHLVAERRQPGGGEHVRVC